MCSSSTGASVSDPKDSPPKAIPRVVKKCPSRSHAWRGNAEWTLLHKCKDPKSLVAVLLLGIRSKQLSLLDEQTVHLHWQVADEMGKLFGHHSLVPVNKYPPIKTSGASIPINRVGDKYRGLANPNRLPPKTKKDRQSLIKDVRFRQERGMGNSPRNAEPQAIKGRFHAIH